jgi:hypothetical protein
MFGFNPYMLLGGAGLILAATTGAFFEGKHVAAGEAAQAQDRALTAAIADGKAKGKRINELEAERQNLENLRASAVREIYHDTSKIIERPVYQNVCIDSDGVKLLDRAQSIASGRVSADPGQLISSSPGPAESSAKH